MSSIALKKYEEWLEEPYFDEATKEELRQIRGDLKEIEDRFYRELEFGTAGLRGIIGAGTNRINKYIVRKTSQGLANYIKKQGQEAKNRGLVIAYDCRRMSREFSQEAARVLAANGIRTYLYKDLRSTPELSFAIRQLNCISGIVVTASHNPPEYNGFKVYWEDGAQIATARAEAIIQSISSIASFGDIEIYNEKDLENEGLIVYLGEEIDRAYIDAVKKQSLRSGEMNKDFKIVFTPLHGTGNIPVRRILKEIGFKKVFVVAEQEKPDSEFPTVKYPNPEEEEAFELALKLAKEKEANLIIGTDPDCDRVGALERDGEGQYRFFNGNQIGVLLVNYILSSLKEKNRLPENGVIIKTIVTSEMGPAIAKKYGLDTINTLTGFKYIGEKIKEFEETGEKTFLIGYEESYGYLAGTHARDKDAVVASMLICEMAAYYDSIGKSLKDVLMELYDEFGYYVEDLKSITLEGKDGLEKMGEIMDYFRKSQLEAIGDHRLIAVEDYNIQERRFLNGGKVEAIDLPKSNVVKFILEDKNWVCLRPSGTEPKLKIYSSFKASSLEEGQELSGKTIGWLEDRIKEV